MGNNVRLSLAETRSLAVRCQLVGTASDLPAGKEGVAQAVAHLGYVQIDSIHVIQRAHHHTLWTRLPDYSHAMLHELHAVDRRLFEYWGHAASYLPISDYRFYLPKMRSYLQPHNKWQRERYEQHGHLMKPVLERIRAEGPLASRDFKPPPGTARGTWWDWKPAKVALEMLFDRGEVMIAERRNFQRIYDLTERVLPPHVDTQAPDDEELGRFLVRRALSAYGVAQEREIWRHIHGGDRRVISDSLSALVEAGEVVEVAVEGATATDYALTSVMEESLPPQATDRRAFLLSPFDNLIIQRERTLRLFGFDYTLECYLPAEKRRYGYFVLPILVGDEFIGRLDAKADRKSQTLIVRNLYFEPECGDRDETLPTLANGLIKFMSFNACKRVTMGTAVPAAISTTLQHHIDTAASA